MSKDNKNYVIKWMEGEVEKGPRDWEGTHYFIRYSLDNVENSLFPKSTFTRYPFIENAKIMKTTKMIEDALCMSKEKANNKLNELKKISFIPENIKIEYIGPIEKCSRFELMEI